DLCRIAAVDRGFDHRADRLGELGHCGHRHHGEAENEKARVRGHEDLVAAQPRSRHPVRKITAITATHSTTKPSVMPKASPIETSALPVKVQRRPLTR